MDSDFSWKQRFEVKMSWWICFSFCLLQMLTDGLEWCGLLVDYCDVFISCLDSHSDGTHSLQSIHCWDSDAVTHFSKSDEETHLSGMAWGQTFIFGWTNVKLCWMQFSPEKHNQNSVSTLVLLRYDINDSHNSVLVLSSTIGYFLLKRTLMPEPTRQSKGCCSKPIPALSSLRSSVCVWLQTAGCSRRWSCLKSSSSQPWGNSASRTGLCLKTPSSSLRTSRSSIMETASEKSPGRGRR